MENFLKRFYFVIYPLLIILILFILDKGFGMDSSFVRFFIAIGGAYILSPRKKIIKTQTGERKQLTWIFLKKPIFLD